MWYRVAVEECYELGFSSPFAARSTARRQLNALYSSAIRRGHRGPRSFGQDVVEVYADRFEQPWEEFLSFGHGGPAHFSEFVGVAYEDV